MDRQRLLETLVDTIQDGIVVADHEANLVMANRWMRTRMLSKGPLIGKKCHMLFENQSEPCPGCVHAGGAGQRAPRTRIVPHVSVEGDTDWFEVTVYALEEADGRFAGSVGHIRDITERVRAEERLKDEIARRRLLVKQSRDAIVVMTEEGGVHEANDEYARQLGYTLEEVYALHIWDWNAEFTKEELLDLIKDVTPAGDHFQTRHVRKDGSICDVEISSNGAVIDGKKLVFCVCRDITEKKSMENQIRELAIRDPLTEAFNRRYVFERLTELAAEHSRGETDFCVSILDLDHFKLVNDTYGHLAGDYVLTEFARTVGALIRPYDLLGRYGGEEFIIVSRNARASDTAAMIERLMEEMRRRPITFQEHSIRVTFSCGLADSSELPRDGFSVEALASLADKRLYQAKAEGRDRCIGCRAAVLARR